MTAPLGWRPIGGTPEIHCTADGQEHQCSPAKTASETV